MDILKDLLGIGVEPKDFSIIHVCVRGLLIFIYCIFLVRIGDKRFLSRKSALDAVLGFILASMMARTINGSAPILPTLAGGLLIVMLHRLFSHFAMKWHWFGIIVKGKSDLAIKEGNPVHENLRKNDFSESDMLEDLRLNGVESPKDVQIAYVERNGEISVVKRKG